MDNSQLILASASPRRQELLRTLGIPFTVRPSHVDETLPTQLQLEDALVAVALRKARASAAPTASWVLAADTAVILDGQVLGKPRDRQQARHMLRGLSGREHRVITALAFLGGGRETTQACVTRVQFRRLTAAQVEWYTALDEPYDKAGGYGIQGRGAFLVTAISGSYTNVVGLPLAEVTDLLDGAGLLDWSPPPPHETAHV